MCGRAKLETDVSEIRIAFRIPPEYPTLNFAPSWNVAPTDNLPIVRYDPKMGSRTLDLMRWGLVPYWAKDIKIGFSTINAMAETIDTKPVFREAFARRRCMVPVDNPDRRMWSGFSEADVRDPTSSAGDFGSRCRRLCGAIPV